MMQDTFPQLSIYGWAYCSGCLLPVKELYHILMVVKIPQRVVVSLARQYRPGHDVTFADDILNLGFAGMKLLGQIFR